MTGLMLSVRWREDAGGDKVRVAEVVPDESLPDPAKAQLLAICNLGVQRDRLACGAIGSSLYSPAALGRQRLTDAPVARRETSGCLRGHRPSCCR